MNSSFYNMAIGKLLFYVSRALLLIADQWHVPGFHIPFNQCKTVTQFVCKSIDLYVFTTTYNRLVGNEIIANSPLYSHRTPKMCVKFGQVSVDDDVLGTI